MSLTTYKHQHVMIIDDNELDIFFLKETMKMVHFSKEITTFENPLDALNFLKQSSQNTPDLIFIDVNMPCINGFQFINYYSEDLSNNTKFVIVSSSDDPNDIKASRTFKNIINYFVKPVNKIDLIFTQNRI